MDITNPAFMGKQDLSGRVAIVTGGGQGIGEATSRRLAAAGARVVIFEIDEEKGGEVAASIGSKAIFIQTDVMSPESVEAAISQTVKDIKRLDILVNNASNVARIGLADNDVVGTDLETWDSVYACNLRGPASTCKFAIPLMLETGGGSIVNIASVQGLSGDLARVAYGSMKAGLIMMSKYIATTFGPAGIRCNSVSPGLVLTPPALTEEVAPFLKIIEDHIPLNTGKQPDDLAEVIAFLASDAARYVNGQNLTVDGGMLSHQPVVADMQRQMPK